MIMNNFLNQRGTNNIRLLITVIIILIMILFQKTVIAQEPTQKEMEEMRKAMEEMQADPEMVEAMKQYGIDMKMVESSMDKVEKDGFGAYYEFEEFMTPKKDDARIASIPKKTLTSAELPAHLAKAEKRVDAAFQGDDRKIADQLLRKVSSFHPDSLAAIANGLWVTSNYLPAAYFMGKASQKDPNPDNLNNYAAFLVMLGGEDLALPILQKLNKEYPGNSTVQNNIGQAWFGLGDLDRAEKYLDSTIKTIAWHPQANMTKAVIQESKGDKAGAVESLKKSVQGGYSITKEDMLRKLGYQLEGKDVDEDFNMPADPLGFDKWIARIPRFPKNHKEQLDLINEWETYYKDIESEKQSLTGKLNRINQEVRAKMSKKGTNQADISKIIAMTKPPYLSAKANHLLNYYTDEKDGKFTYEYARIMEDFKKQADLQRSTRDEFLRLVEAENAKCQDGEGKPPCPPICPVIVPAYDNMINTQNTPLETCWNDFLDLWSTRLEAAAYYYQYSVSDQLLIEQNELRLKLEFIGYLGSIHPSPGPDMLILSCLDDDSKKPASHKLAEWNDLHCDRNVTYAMPLTGYMKFTCNTTELHLEPLLLPFEVHYKENLETGQIISASAAVSIRREIDKTGVSVKVGAGYDAEKGTVKLEGSVGTKIGGVSIGDEKLGGMPGKIGATGGGFIEFDKNGVSDLGFKAGVEGKPDLKYGEKNNETDIRVGKVEVGGKWSWNAGGSGVAKGTLNGSINPSNFSAPSKK